MSTTAREYIDFWIENSVHAAEQTGSVGASQDIGLLISRLVEGAHGQGITREALEAEVGDLSDYIGSKLTAANKVERDRRV
jgi:hypothetical protein